DLAAVELRLAQRAGDADQNEEQADGWYGQVEPREHGCGNLGVIEEVAQGAQHSNKQPEPEGGIGSFLVWVWNEVQKRSTRADALQKRILRFAGEGRNIWEAGDHLGAASVQFEGVHCTVRFRVSDTSSGTYLVCIALLAHLPTS